MSKRCGCKLSPCALGMALGLIWAIANLLTGLGATYFDWGNEFVKVMGSLYIGYDNTLTGSFIGTGWAFVDAFIGGVVFGWLYNCFRCCRCGTCCDAGSDCKTKD